MPRAGRASSGSSAASPRRRSIVSNNRARTRAALASGEFAMKRATTIAATALLLAAMAMPQAHAQDDHKHHAPAAEIAKERPAQRYATDAPLRQGMARIRIAVDALG